METNSTSGLKIDIKPIEKKVIDIKEIYEKLSEPIEEEYLSEYTEDGKIFKTFNVQIVINRLNTVVGIENWTTNSKIRKEELINGSWAIAMEIIITLKINDKEIKVVGSGGSYASKIANAYKGARSSALKNAARYLGIGKELYLQTPDEELVYEKIEENETIPEEAVDLEKKIKECQNMEQLESLEGKVKGSEKSIQPILYKKYNEKKISLFK